MSPYQARGGRHGSEADWVSDERWPVDLPGPRGYGVPLRLASAYAAEAANGAYAEPSTVSTFTGGAATGTETRTLWHTESDEQLSVTTALFAEYPSRGDRPARPAPLGEVLNRFALSIVVGVRKQLVHSVGVKG
ncbi:hypothetical protein [Streptomyces sp. NPDC085932]|uniref:hypothetical protein n=1 Tax=Streptomyces sp. NPDC085932 TaxID=3365741 RepID=UPI0037D79A4C